ncbi:MAG: branched-chain amino acid ABC transporter permease [Rhodobacteraceae bacterium]|nr:MAG: branched-chain amino acid ABC transporter permease [Paracoccaceae bacterium]
MEANLQYVLSGLSIGGVYAMVALGFSMMWSVAKAANFTHGDVFMLGGVLTVSLMALGLPIWIAAILAILIAAAAGALIERFLVRPFNREANAIGWMLTTIAIGVMMESFGTATYGPLPQPLPSPLAVTPLRFGGAGVFPQELLLPVVAVLAMLGLRLFQTRTHFGRAIRAVAANRVAAGLMGIDADRVTMVVFAAAGGLGALAGFLIAPVIQASTTMGLVIGLKAFMIAIIAGITNAAGVVTMALAFGVVERLIEGYLSTSARDAFGFTLMILVLLAFPQGVFGRKEVSKV